MPSQIFQPLFFLSRAPFWRIGYEQTDINHIRLLSLSALLHQIPLQFLRYNGIVETEAVLRMKKFMEPRSVALVGISSKVGKGSLNLLENLLQIGFPGKIYPVNPNIQELLGQKVFPDIGAIPDAIDLAVIMTPRQVVPTVLEQCVKKAIDSVLIITQGFAEADEEGKALQIF